MKKKHDIRNNSFVDDQLTCCSSLYCVSKFKSPKYFFHRKETCITMTLYRKFSLSDGEKFPSCRKRSCFSSLVSTLEFVFGRDVQLPLESVHSLFS